MISSIDNDNNDNDNNNSNNNNDIIHYNNAIMSAMALRGRSKKT